MRGGARFAIGLLGAIVSACGGSGFSVGMTGSPGASPTSDSGAVLPDANSASTFLVDSSDEEQTVPDGSSIGGDVTLADGAGPGDGSGLVDAPTRTCPSACAQLNANCGAVADTFCGGV